ncbi:hypothetical protein QC762_0099710 [Podospora pseudocomata]|uniref:NB-ARC domain-containing protein n=1 Tax=Podospora pseudocomata TaxID=2093779 RepID=A0ABR0G8M7_9PEZI|nr:hypothetical protein QC762_0099710 [Podospora pseudocomata]
MNCLSILEGIRMSETEQNRSLIFVAHSFGGSWLNKALVQARASRDFGHVAEHAQTIIFLGTPHRGTSFGLWGWLAAKGLQPLGSNPSILADLEYDSFSLHDLHKDFMAVAPDDLRVFNFFEKRPTCILRLWFVRLERFCVHEQSATYEGRNVRNIGLSVDHYGLNKFASKNESYQSILSKLTESIRASARPVKHHYAVPLGRVDTYTERVGLSAELEQKLHIRHKKASVPYAVSLYGLGGVGKSQLALDYAEKHKHDYNPILWIDATDEETVRSSFKICAAELGLTVEGGENQGSIITDAGVRAVLRWLCDRSEADDEWLLIVDNADDVSWGIQKVMPRGNRGRVIITSRDEQSTKLVGGTCESVRVGDMSPPEGRALLLRHLQLDEELAPGDIKDDCDRVVKKLEFLALAIDIAGAYIGSHSPCDKALQRYLADYERHRDELLQMDFFRGLLATEKTVWTVWDTTLEKIAMENKGLLPDVLLTFLAHFKGGIIQDEMFRLASLGMEKVKANMGEEESEGMPFELQQFLPLAGDKWDDFRYQQGCRLLLRYSLLQRVDGGWAGVTMHGLVRWRAMLSHRSRPWRQWYMVFVLAACYQNIEEEQPEFRRHLVGHLPDIHGDDGQEREYFLRYPSFIGETIGRIYYDEGRWEEAEKLQVQVMETRKTKLGADHPDTLTSMINLASTYRNQGRWEEAEKLEVQVMETSKMKLGVDHPSTLTSIGNLASTYMNQGRWEEAEKLEVQVMETRKTKLGADHPDTLTGMANLALTFWSQGRWEEAEKLQLQVMETSKIKLGADHPDTLRSMANLASTFSNQGRLEEAEKLEVQVMETSKIKLGADHPSTLTSMANLASTYRNQGRWEEAEKLEVQVMETRKTKLGADHPDTLMSIGNLASTYRNQGRWKEAEKLQLQVMETSKIKLGADHPDSLTGMANLALTFWSQGRWEEAEKLQVQVMETSKMKLGVDHPSTLTSMANLASTFWSQGRWEEAEKLQVQVMETNKMKLGVDHPSTLTSMANLASTYRNQGRWEEAEKLEMQVMETRKTKLGADHPDTLRSMANLALTFWNQGRWEEAEKLQLQVMETSKIKLGADHPSTLTSMANLASTYRNQGRWEEAEKLEVQVMETSKIKLGADHLDTLTAQQRVLGDEHPYTLMSLAIVAKWSS